MTTTAKTIAEQIGNVAFAMIGAHSLVGSETALQFGIRGSKRCNKIRVVYEAGADLYTVEAWKCRGVNISRVGVSEDVFADSLRTTITALTGLYTTF
jgi:hypothetical protein